MSVSTEYSMLTIVIITVAIVVGGAALLVSLDGSGVGFRSGSVVVERINGYVAVNGIVTGDVRARVCEVHVVWDTPNGTVSDTARVDWNGTLVFSLFGPGGRVSPAVIENGSQLNLMVPTRGWRVVSVTLYLCPESGGRISLSVPVG